MQHEWIPSAFTPAAQRTPMQHAALKENDALVRELQAAEVLVIGMPMYNFGMPAPLKAWVDNIVRIGLTSTSTQLRKVDAWLAGGPPP